ncbi:hypothetical protein ACLB1T_01605 [Escherichia coli]
MIQALADARYDDNIGVIILTGAGDKALLVVTRKCVVITAAIKMIPAYIT